MAVTADEAIETLQTAMAQGVTSVTYSDGRRVDYADQKGLERAIAHFQAQKRSAAGRPAVSVSVGTYARG